ncbi:ABC transporter ATP-binding protein [Fannyhessea vaginae]|uniref:ABC transporter ATP-binding protein n=1 Tax=Fannyhessea vaginae TaxID=82135 RepID=UPI0023F24771|nr:ABC transporter ATP-binding protein [Fannyhessea vaginae]
MKNPYVAAGSAQTIVSNTQNSQASGSSTAQSKTDALVFHAVAPTRSELVHFLMPFFKPKTASFIQSIVLCTLASCCSFSIPLCIGLSVDALFTPGMPSLSTYLLLLLVSIMASALFEWTGVVRFTHACVQSIRALRSRCFALIQNIPLTYITKDVVSDIHNRLIMDCDQISDGLILALNQSVRGLIIIVGSFVCMCLLCWQMALIIIVLLPCFMFINSYIASRGQSYFEAQLRAQENMMQFIHESARMQKLLRTTCASRARSQQFCALNHKVEVQAKRAQFLSSLANPTTRLIQNLLYAFVVTLGAFCVVTQQFGHLSVGALVSLLVYTQQLTKPINELSGLSTQIQTAYTSMIRIVQLLMFAKTYENNSDEAFDGNSASRAVTNTASVRATGDTTQACDPCDPCDTRYVQSICNTSTHVSAPRAPLLKVSNISFSYDGTHNVIHDLSFEVYPHQTLALVGHTGCGKSTLLHLLMRLYPLGSGEIYFREVAYQQMSAQEVRKHFGMVLQDVSLINASVYENIAYGSSNATPEYIRSVASKVGAHDFISQLPQGYDTHLSQNDTRLSKGQIQLICIARALVFDPEILLLDEPTSSLDTRSEAQVTQALQKLMESRSCIVVAHRLSTIKDADHIIVMDKGSMVEQGTHVELLAKHGEYAQLFASQFDNA